MVVAMVRLSAAIVDGTASTTRWGLVYGASWAAIVGLAWRLVEDADAADAPDLLALVVGAWGAFHAFWIWLALGITPGRASTRQLAGRLGFAGLVFAAIGAFRLADVGAIASRVRGSPLAWMILTAVLGVVMMVAGGVRRARRDSRADGDEIGEAYARRNAESQPSLRDNDPAMLLIGLGAALMIGGTFGAGIAAGPAPVKVLCAGALAFVAFQVVRYLRR